MVLVRMQCGKMPGTTPEYKLSFAWLRAHFIVFGTFPTVALFQ